MIPLHFSHERKSHVVTFARSIEAAVKMRTEMVDKIRDSVQHAYVPLSGSYRNGGCQTKDAAQP